MLDSFYDEADVFNVSISVHTQIQKAGSETASIHYEGEMALQPYALVELNRYKKCPVVLQVKVKYADIL